MVATQDDAGGGLVSEDDEAGEGVASGRRLLRGGPGRVAGGVRSLRIAAARRGPDHDRHAAPRSPRNLRVPARDFAPHRRVVRRGAYPLALPDLTEIDLSAPPRTQPELPMPGERIFWTEPDWGTRHAAAREILSRSEPVLNRVDAKVTGTYTVTRQSPRRSSGHLGPGTRICWFL